MDSRKQYVIIVAAMAVTMILGVAMFPHIITSLIVHRQPPPAFIPQDSNLTDQILKSIQAQEPSFQKNMTLHPCIGGGTTLRPGVLCPEDNNLTQQYHPSLVA
jgi:hypothetical protein